MTELKTWDYWYDALDAVRDGTEMPPVHDGHVEPGYYRYKVKDGIDRPCAIWQESDGTMKCLVGDKVRDPEVIWINVCRRPISKELYDAVAREGKPWPDAIPPLPKITNAEEAPLERKLQIRPAPGAAVEDPGPAPIGSNNPPPDEAELDEVDAAVKAAEAALAEGIKTQDAADRLGNHRDRLKKMWTAKDNLRKVEKQPFIEGANAVEAKFKPILGKIESIGAKVQAALTEWLQKERARLQILENERARKAEAERQAALAMGEKPPRAAAAKPKEVKAGAGTTGRKTALRSIKRAQIEDFETALLSFKDHEKVVELIQSLANAQARIGVVTPGCKIIEEEKAV